MFQPVSKNPKISDLEEEILRYWRRQRVFEQRTERLASMHGPLFVLYGEPPTAHHPPAENHWLARAHQDCFLRYKAMRGYQVSQRAGWNAQGLAIEWEVEKRLGLKSKAQIEEFGVGRFNQLCRKIAFDYIQDWERFLERSAFWANLDDAYVTFTISYIESVWWILHALWEKDMLSQEERVVFYCPRCETALSSDACSISNDQLDTPSLFVRLPLVEDPGTSLLVWTTSPWQLPGNVAIAAHPEIDYAIVEHALPEGGTERLILAHHLINRVFGDEPVQVYETFRGLKLRSLRYQPLFTFLLPQKPAYMVVLTDFVDTEQGTGLMPLAPAYHAHARQAAKDYNLPVLQIINNQGCFLPEIRPWRGISTEKANQHVRQDLQARGLLLRSETILHPTPVCRVCSTPLISVERNVWVIRPLDQPADKENLGNREASKHEIDQHPRQFQDRMGETWLKIEQEWVVGRERFWGTPLPIWECEQCGSQSVIGSVSELSQRAALSGDDRDLTNLDLHRPFIDEIKLTCQECKSGMRRVPEIVDSRLDRGAMPVAQWHFPFENQDRYQAYFPADLICEPLDRGWGWVSASQLLSTALFKQAIARHMLGLEDLSEVNERRSGENITAPWRILQDIQKYGADLLRWNLFINPGSDLSYALNPEQTIEERLISQTSMRFIQAIWECYAFFVSAANHHGWIPGESVNNPFTILPATQQITGQILDRWLLGCLYTTTEEVSAALERYAVTDAAFLLQDFVLMLSEWYLPRSRKRFSTRQDEAAFKTLYTTLVTLCKLLAPFMPFLAEAIYQNLVASGDTQVSPRVSTMVPTSVHLTDWPRSGELRIAESLDQDPLRQEMDLVIKLASLGQASRRQAGVPDFQPLEEVIFVLPNLPSEGLLGEWQNVELYSDLLVEALNVRRVTFVSSTDQPHTAGLTGRVIIQDGKYLAVLITELTPELQHAGLAGEFIHQVQEMRAQIDIGFFEPITVHLQASPELVGALESYRPQILAETQAGELRYSLPEECDAWQSIELSAGDRRELVTIAVSLRPG